MATRSHLLSEHHLQLPGHGCAPATSLPAPGLCTLHEQLLCGEGSQPILLGPPQNNTCLAGYSEVPVHRHVSHHRTAENAAEP